MVTGIRIGQNDGTVRSRGDERMNNGTRHHGLRIRSATEGDFSTLPGSMPGMCGTERHRSRLIHRMPGKCWHAGRHFAH